MKNFKRLASVLLAAVLVMGMSITAFAAGPYSITINNSKSGHVYEVYQIFTGTLESDGSWTGIDWGTGVTDAGKTAMSDATAKADTLTDEAAAKAFATELVSSGYLDNTSLPAVDTSVPGVYKISGLAQGYYLIKDADGSVTGENDSYTAYILEVANDEDVSPKGDIPTVQKKVKDTNDSENTTSAWQDSADYDKGDDVPYQLTGTLPTYYDEYDYYEYVFKDTIPDNFGDPENIVVYLTDKDGNKIAEFVVDPTPTSDTDDEKYYTVEIDAEGNPTISFKNLKEVVDENGNLIDIDPTDKIVVEYTSELTDQAELGDAGNPSDVYLVYSNNPNVTSEGNGNTTGQTTKDKVTVFTYTVVINKVDENLADLDGAAFTLYKKNSSGVYIEVEAKTGGTGITTFEFTHLDDGEYKLVETEVPENYNKLADQYFTIVATHDTASDDPQLTDLTATSPGSITFAGDEATGTLTSDVVNKPGSTLPETGGVGTTIFYIVGAVLVIGAGVLLITKKRMDNK